MTGALGGGGERKGRISDRDIAAIRERVSPLLELVGLAALAGGLHHAIGRQRHVRKTGDVGDGRRLAHKKAAAMQAGAAEPFADQAPAQDPAAAAAAKKELAGKAGDAALTAKVAAADKAVADITTAQGNAQKDLDAKKAAKAKATTKAATPKPKKPKKAKAAPIESQA